MTTSFYFVRHGETDFNRASIMQGRKIDSVLNRLGRAQATALAERMRDVPLDAIYTSTLRRARETASIVARGRQGIGIYPLHDLEEMSWGVYDGLSPGEGVNEAYDRWCAGEFGHAVPGGESILDVQLRGIRAMEEIMNAHGGGSVLVVTHGRFLRILLATLLEEYGLERMDEIKHANTGFNHLTYASGRFEALLLNCTAHLESDGAVFAD